MVGTIIRGPSTFWELSNARLAMCQTGGSPHWGPRALTPHVVSRSQKKTRQAGREPLWGTQRENQGPRLPPASFPECDSMWMKRFWQRGRETCPHVPGSAHTKARGITRVQRGVSASHKHSELRTALSELELDFAECCSPQAPAPGGFTPGGGGWGVCVTTATCCPLLVPDGPGAGLPQPVPPGDPLPPQRSRGQGRAARPASECFWRYLSIPAA